VLRVLRALEDNRRFGVPSMGEAVVEEGLVFLLPFGAFLGGWGKEPILMVLRSVLAGLAAGDMPFAAALGPGKLEAEPFCAFACAAGDRVGSAEEADRCWVSGAGSSEAPEPLLDTGVVGVPNSDFRVFGTGSEGRGVFGGPSEGREGRGKVAMFAGCTTSVGRCRSVPISYVNRPVVPLAALAMHPSRLRIQHPCV
jgi:hypothetical protein